MFLTRVFTNPFCEHDLSHTILELPKLDSWEFGANLSQTLLVAEFNKNLKL